LSNSRFEYPLPLFFSCVLSSLVSLGLLFCRLVFATLLMKTCLRWLRKKNILPLSRYVGRCSIERCLNLGAHMVRMHGLPCEPGCLKAVPERQTLWDRGSMTQAMLNEFNGASKELEYY
jgi:hypothetical protein